VPTLILILKYENIKFKKRIPSGRSPTSKLQPITSLDSIRSHIQFYHDWQKKQFMHNF
jgi:hypothetical protein